MDVWLDYALSDFLLFGPETYWRLFEKMNLALWPGQLVMFAVGCCVLAVCVKAWHRSGLVVGVALAIAWTLVTILFFQEQYASINWAVAYVIPVLWLQVVLTLLLAPGLTFEKAHRRDLVPLAVAAVALVYPALSLLQGRSWLQSEVAGVAPTPTALLAIALVAMAQPASSRLILLVIPVLWLVLSTLTTYVLEGFSLSFWLPPSMMVALCMAEVWRRKALAAESEASKREVDLNDCFNSRGTR